MTEALRFGIIGCGVIAPTHAEALGSLPDARLVAVTDTTPAKAAKLALQHQVTAYTSIEEMLEQADLDVVCICTPSGMHGEHACQVMRSGRHVIIEKPMEITPERLSEIQQVQKETGRKLAVISQHRFDEATQQVHALVEKQAFGRLVLGNAAVPWWRSQQYYDSGAWRGTRALDGGGILMNQSIHSIDLLQWLMGRVKSIRAYTDTLVHQMETEDVGVAVLRFENGALGTINATTGAYPGVTTRIEIFGDRGSAVIADDRLTYLHLAEEGKEVGPYGGRAENIVKQKTHPVAGTSSNPAALSSSTHALQIADMIRAIREDGTPLVDAYAARHPVDIILGIYEAARSGEEVIL